MNETVWKTDQQIKPSQSINPEGIENLKTPNTSSLSWILEQQVMNQSFEVLTIKTN